MYGSLMSGQGSHARLHEAAGSASELAGRGRTVDNYVMFAAGTGVGGYNGGRGVPIVHPTMKSRSSVHGEVWALNDVALADADGLEGHPGWYTRSPVAIRLECTGEVVEAELYLKKHMDDTDGSVEPAVRVPSGDFRVLPSVSPGAAQELIGYNLSSVAVGGPAMLALDADVLRYLLRLLPVTVLDVAARSCQELCAMLRPVLAAEKPGVLAERQEQWLQKANGEAELSRN